MNDTTDGGVRAMVLFSGGQDSATCLAWALQRHDQVETVGFSYGQRHGVELEARARLLDAFHRDFPQWAGRLGGDRILNLDVLREIGGEALTGDVEITMGENGLPTTFVPGRNLLFLTSAAALAYRRGASVLVGGMCETDFSGYPDCRLAAIEAQGEAIRLGMAFDLTIETPLMHLSKAQTWALAHDLGGDALVELILEESHTCYRGVRDLRHPWGYGCADCPACKLRAAGYALWKASRRAG